MRAESLAVGVIAAAGVLGALWVWRRRASRRQKPPQQWRPVATLKKIHLYPLKSGRRIELKSANVGRFGLSSNRKYERALRLHDRSFVIVGEDGELKTARTFPKIVHIEMGVHDEQHITLDAPGMRQLYVKVPSVTSVKPSIIRLHEDEKVFSLDCGNEAAVWISRYIHGKEAGLRISYHDGSEEHQRDLRETYQEMVKYHSGLTSAAGLYSDLAAVLLVNEESVRDLNTRIEAGAVSVEHFRPNLIVSGEGAPAFGEDYWQWIRIGDVILRNVKPCTRCMFTTIDPEKGERNSDREPLKTLEKYRKKKGIFEGPFEENLTVMGVLLGVFQGGEINQDDTVYVGI